MNKFIYNYSKYLDIADSAVNIIKNVQLKKNEKPDSETKIVLLNRPQLIKSNKHFTDIIVIYNSRREGEEKAISISKITLKDFGFKYHGKLRTIDNGRKTCFFKDMFFLFGIRICFFAFIRTLQSLPGIIYKFSTGRRISIFTSQFINEIFTLYIQDKSDILVLLKTSNNRLTEAIRISAILNNCDTVEILHGLCTSEFARFYSLINKLVTQSSAQIGYIDPFINMPQPIAIQSGLITSVLGDKEKYSFSSSQPKNHIRRIVAIIGGSAGNNLSTYSNTNFYLLEKNMIIYCNQENIPFIYFAHPKLGSLIINKHGLKVEKTAIGISDYRLEDCLITGFFSSALFEHDSSNNIFIFSDARDLLGEEAFTKREGILIGEFSDFCNLASKWSRQSCNIM